MTQQTQHSSNMAARDWIHVLAKYREPNAFRSSFELGVSIVPFVALWIMASWIAGYSALGAIAIAVLNGGFLVRLFAIQHDCGHGSFFGNRVLSDWVGRALGVLTLTPYDVWRRTHSIHHSHSGNLTHRGIGDVMTLTVDEYRARTWLGRLSYRLYRHPLVLFGLGPSYLFFFQNRLPLSLMRQSKYWISAMGTNIAIAAVLAVIIYFGGFKLMLLVFVPTTLIAATIGVWLFYVQHQFESTHWEHAPDWSLHEAALHGSSHYDLPPVLQWFSANLGIHHIHHLYARIPFYRLPEVLKSHEGLTASSRLTLRQSLHCASLDLWDEKAKALISFAKARRLGAQPEAGRTV